jgi:acyl-CoA synthetase (AMP-forming)/AMP-acid ligase II/thioesterase domain-containing protein
MSAMPQLSADPAGLDTILLGVTQLNPASGIWHVDAGGGELDFLPYSAVLDEARCILGGLRASGVGTRDKVVLSLESARQAIPALWACILGGFIPCPVLPSRADADQLAAQLRGLGILLDQPWVVTTEAIRREMPPAAQEATLALETLSDSAPDPTAHMADGNDVALLMLTSGSTGNAKAVQLTHANLLASMTAKINRLAVTGDDVTMNWISFDHIAAVEMHLMPLLAGASQLHVGPQFILSEPLRFLKLIDSFRVTVTFTPNFLMGKINDAIAQESHDLPIDLSSIRHIICGGEAVVCATGRRFLDQLEPFGLDRKVLLPAFGMTETCAGSVFSGDFPQIDDDSQYASLGYPITGVEARIVDDNNELSPDHVVGHLQIRGSVVFVGYLNNDEANQAAFTADGWFRTGDLGFLANGRLTLAGRSKDTIIVNGVNYFSHDLETVLERLEGIARSSVAAFPTRAPAADSEDLVVTFQSTVPVDDEAGLHRLITAIRSSTVLHWGFRPTLILPLAREEIPKTSLGKIQRSLLRRRLESGQYESQIQSVAEIARRQLGGYSAPQGDAEIKLTDIYAEMFGMQPGTVSATASFLDLGGTSLDILLLKRHVEIRFGIKNVPVMWLLTAPTARALAERISSGEQEDPEHYDPLVALQRTGSKTPLFCVHPGVGEVLVFVNLAKYFLHERPFFALRARGFEEGEQPFSSFAEMVDCYVDAIRSEQPHGPYAVAGYSYGGAVAFEIAKELEAVGEKVDFVGVFNLPPHIKSRMHELDFVEGAVNLAFFLSLITKEQAAELPKLLRKSLPPHDLQLDYLLSIASKDRLAELNLDLPKFKAWVELANSMVGLGRTYEPSGTVESLSVFYAIPLHGTKEDWLHHELSKWDGFSRGPNRYIDVPGEHYTLMGPEHVGTFQGILRKELERALGDDR